MANITDSTVLDGSLNIVKNGCVKVVATVGEPTSFANASANLGTGSGQKVLDVTTTSADFTLAAASSGGGRQLTSAAKANLTGLATGNADHLVFLSSTGILAAAVLAAPFAVTQGNSYTIPSQKMFNRPFTSV